MNDRVKTVSASAMVGALAVFAVAVFCRAFVRLFFTSGDVSFFEGGEAFFVNAGFFSLSASIFGALVGCFLPPDVFKRP